MKKLLFLLFAASFFVSTALYATNEKNEKPFVIPELREWQGASGTFELTPETRIVYKKGDKEMKQVAEQFAADIKKMFGKEIATVAAKSAKGDICIAKKADKKLGDEGYKIIIGEKLTLTAPTAQGVFWGTRTLLQILEQNNGSKLPKGTIKDHPDYAMRGFMLDCGRKYIPIEFLREYVQFMSYYKMNTFQIHLNDNAFHKYFENNWDKTPGAFRLESEYFPELTARDGHYTKQEFIDLQKLAESLFVEIIPEIDAPAHSLAFTKFRPEIGSKEYGVDHLDLFNPATYTFIDSLYDEYLKGDEPVFRGKRVHVGTDEYSNRDTAVVEKFRYFTDHCIRLVESYDKQACVWGALTHAKGNTPVKVDNVIMHVWYNGYANPVDMINLGYNCVSIPDGWLYIVPAAGYYYDYLNCKHLYEAWTPAQIGGEKFEELHPQINGGMFAVWNDHAGNGISTKDIHYRVYPAMQTLAVKMWTGAKPSTPFEQFNKARTVLSDAPGLNIAGRFSGEKRTILALDEVLPESENTIEEIGFDYSVTFDIEAKEEKRGTVLFSSRDTEFYLSDPVSGMLGFSRDGYLNTFSHRFFSGEKATVTISGDEKETHLYINGKLVETLNKQTLLHNDGKDKMYYVRTLVFPLKKAGKFNSKITNLKVTNSSK